MKSFILTFIFTLCIPLIAFSWPEDTYNQDQVTRAIRAGDHYFICDTAVKEAGETLSVGITVPAYSTPHVRFEISSSAGINYSIYEGASEFSNGTSITPRNSKRTSSKSSALDVVSDPTYTSNGTMLYDQHAGADKVAGSSGHVEEVILKSNENYLFEATSDAASNEISFCLGWYE